jgi:hypothetical protein
MVGDKATKVSIEIRTTLIWTKADQQYRKNNPNYENQFSLAANHASLG